MSRYSNKDMPDPSVQNFRLAAIGLFAVSTLYFSLLQEFLPAVITMIAGFSYIAMYLREQHALAARYADWALTTPLILFLILSKAKVGMGKILFVMAADFLMILTGYFGRIEQDPTKRMMWYWLGMLLFLPVLMALAAVWKSQKGALLSLTIWLLYPMVWLAAERQVISHATEEKITAVMDTTAKVGFGLLTHLE